MRASLSEISALVGASLLDVYTLMISFRAVWTNPVLPALEPRTEVKVSPQYITVLEKKNTLPLACLVTEIGQHQSESLWTLWHDFRRHLKGTETSEIMSQRCRNKGEKLRTVKSLLLWSQQAAIFGFPADRYLCEDPPTGTDNWTAVTGGRYIQPPQLTAERGGALIIPGYFHAAVLFEVISWGQICFVSKLISLGGLHLSHNLWIFKYILVQTDPSLNCCHLWLWWM